MIDERVRNQNNMQRIGNCQANAKEKRARKESRESHESDLFRGMVVKSFDPASYFVAVSVSLMAQAVRREEDTCTKGAAGEDEE